MMQQLLSLSVQLDMISLFQQIHEHIKYELTWCDVNILLTSTNDSKYHKILFDEYYCYRHTTNKVVWTKYPRFLTTYLKGGLQQKYCYDDSIYRHLIFELPFSRKDALSVLQLLLVNTTDIYDRLIIRLANILDYQIGSRELCHLMIKCWLYHPKHRNEILTMIINVIGFDKVKQAVSKCQHLWDTQFIKQICQLCKKQSDSIILQMVEEYPLMHRFHMSNPAIIRKKLKM
jgi:hypothetical protein